MTGSPEKHQESINLLHAVIRHRHQNVKPFIPSDDGITEVLLIWSYVLLDFLHYVLVYVFVSEMIGALSECNPIQR